jgi:hypothetical protein
MEICAKAFALPAGCTLNPANPARRTCGVPARSSEDGLEEDAAAEDEDEAAADDFTGVRKLVSITGAGVTKASVGGSARCGVRSEAPSTPWRCDEEAAAESELDAAARLPLVVCFVDFGVCSLGVSRIRVGVVALLLLLLLLLAAANVEDAPSNAAGAMDAAATAEEGVSPLSTLASFSSISSRSVCHALR